MTLPALALFYGGLVHTKNVLSVSESVRRDRLPDVSALVSRSAIRSPLAMAAAANTIWGGVGKAFLSGVTAESAVGSIPESVFFMFQMTFAIITPALIVGAYPERTNFLSVLIFSSVWMLLVYAPVCHWVWGGGWLNKEGVRDLLAAWWFTPQQARPRLCSPSCWASGRVFPHQCSRLTAPCW